MRAIAAERQRRRPWWWWRWQDSRGLNGRTTGFVVTNILDGCLLFVVAVGTTRLELDVDKLVWFERHFGTRRCGSRHIPDAATIWLWLVGFFDGCGGCGVGRQVVRIEVGGFVDGRVVRVVGEIVVAVVIIVLVVLVVVVAVVVAIVVVVQAGRSGLVVVVCFGRGSSCFRFAPKMFENNRNLFINFLKF